MRIWFLLGTLAACSFDGQAGGSDGPERVDGRARDARIPDGPPGVDAKVDARPADAAGECPPGYEVLGASLTHYRIVDSPTAAWDAAAADCNDDDDEAIYTGHTHLAVIGDEVERLGITPSFSGNRWVGLTDAVTEGTFLWVTAEDTGGYPVVGQEPPWDAGDPDGGTTENCVRFKTSFGFEDKVCTAAMAYLCECDGFAPQ